jgi:regulatory protein
MGLNFMGSKEPRRLEAGQLWNYALKILGGRAHSTGELREKLRRRAAKAEDVEPMLGRLKDYGYLDDRRYAESYATARLNNDKLGSARVVRDLRQRRVAPALAEKSVSQAYRDVKEEELIEDWVRRKYRLAAKESLFQEDKDVAGAYRRLLRAGFRGADILRVLKRFARNPDLIEEFEPPEEGE